MRSRVKTTKESLKANREQLNDLADTVRVSSVIQSITIRLCKNNDYGGLF